MKKNIQIIAVMISLMASVPVTFAEVEKPTVKMIETSAKTDFAWADLKVSAVERDEAWDELQKIFVHDTSGEDELKEQVEKLAGEAIAAKAEIDRLEAELEKEQGVVLEFQLREDNVNASASVLLNTDEAPSTEVMLHKNVRHGGKRWPAGGSATLPDSVLEDLDEGTYSDMDSEDSELVEA